MKPEMPMEQALIALLEENDRFMRDLELVRSLRLPDGHIAAGYIRNQAWDRLHGFKAGERHADIDVVFYDPADRSERRDEAAERQLREMTGDPKWSVKNQARMHIRNGDAPYDSLSDALSRWPETATAVGARLDDNGRITLVHPYGLADLFGLVVRRSPAFADGAYYLDRIRKKGWSKLWPLLSIIEQ